MGVFCDRLKLGSKAALDCLTGQNKCKYREKELVLRIFLIATRLVVYVECNIQHFRYKVISNREKPTILVVVLICTEGDLC